MFVGVPAQQELPEPHQLLELPEQLQRPRSLRGLNRPLYASA